MFEKEFFSSAVNTLLGSLVLGFCVTGCYILLKRKIKDKESLEKIKVNTTKVNTLTASDLENIYTDIKKTNTEKKIMLIALSPDHKQIGKFGLKFSKKLDPQKNLVVLIFDAVNYEHIQTTIISFNEIESNFHMLMLENNNMLLIEE